MALCRCKEHIPIGRKKSYVVSVEPIGYLSTSSVCGIKKCRNEGLIWLDEFEYEDYKKGEDTFEYLSSVTKVRVKKYHL